MIISRSIAAIIQSTSSDPLAALDLRHRRQGRRRPDRRVAQGVEGAQALLERGAHLVKRVVILNQKCRTRNGLKLLREVFGGFKLFANHDLWGGLSWFIFVAY